MTGLEQWLAGLPGGVVYLVVFMLVWAESAIFAGFVIPGETGLLLGGVLAGLGRIDVVAVAVCGIAGAIIGDSVGFEVGRHFGPRLRTTRLGRLVTPSHWGRAEVFMTRYGGRSVFLGRWVSFGRALVPALAGATRMRYPTFLLWNAVGGATWAVTVTALGFFAGGSWRQVEKIFGRAVLLVVLAALVVAGIVAAARWVARHPDRVRAWAHRQAERPRIRALLARYDRQVAWLARRVQPRSAFGLELTAGLALILAIGWFFGALVQDVIAGEDAARLDLPVLRWLAAHRDPTLTQVMAVVRDLTGVWAALAAVIIWLVLGWRRGVRPLPAVSAWAGALLCALMVAFIVGRTPPPAAYAVAAAPPAPGSFPALGVTVTTAVAGLLATQVSLAVRSWGRAVAAWTAALLWAGAAGAAAAYLGTHWITDVAAAWALGAAWDAVLITAWWTRTRPQAGATPVPRHHAGPDATGAPHRGR